MKKYSGSFLDWRKGIAVLIRRLLAQSGFLYHEGAKAQRNTKGKGITNIQQGMLNVEKGSERYNDNDYNKL